MGGISLTPHGFCLLRDPGLIWLHAGSDMLTGLSCMAIATTVLVFECRRPDSQFGMVSVLFACFIAAFGASYFISILTLWVPAYYTEGILKLGLAALSMTVAGILWQRLPSLLARPSQQELLSANLKLQEAETATATLNHALGLAVRIARVGHWRIQLPAKTSHWSDEVFRIHGLDRADHAPRFDDAAQIYLPEDRERVAACIERCLHSGEGCEFTARLARPDGDVRHVLSRGIVQRAADGSITAIFGVCMDVTEQKRVEARLRQLNEEAEAANCLLAAQATQDSLTGLANRRKFDVTLDLEFRRARRNGAPMALIMIDVDHFKSYNDLYGHMAGDTCLRAIAAVIGANASRAGDVAARFGGEEFSVLMSGTAETEASRTAARILGGIQALDLPHAGSNSGRVTISAGISVHSPTGGQSATQFLEAADQALYQAKQSGRCCVCVEPIAYGLMEKAAVQSSAR